MVLTRTNLNRGYVAYPPGLNHSTDTLLLDLVPDTPHFKSRSHTPYVKTGFPTPLIEIGFLNGQIETRFTNHRVLIIIMTVSHHCTQIQDHTDHVHI